MSTDTCSLLADKECVPCKGGVPPLAGEELHNLHAELGHDWQLIEDHHIEKEFKFPNFVDALAFTNAVGAIAEEQNHHPDILTAWGKVKVTVWSHKAKGLTEADFVFAAKCEKVVA